MIKTIKKLPRFAVFLCLTIISSCQNDDIANAEPSLVKTTSKWITSEELNSMPKAVEKLNSIDRIKNNAALGRNIHLPDYNFSVNTDKVLLLEKGNNHSLIFQVYRTYTTAKVENLVLSSTSAGNGYEAYLLEYDFNEQDISNFEHGIRISDAMHKMSYKKLENFDENILLERSGGYSGSIIKLNDGSCGVVDHIWEENGITWVSYVPVGCPAEAVTIITTTADPIYTGGGWIVSTGPSEGTEPGGGGGDNGDDEEDPILVQPVLLLNHEKELKGITSKTNIKAKINELRTRCINPNELNEDGAQYIKAGSNYTERLPSFTGPNETRFDPDFVPNAEVVIHMHQLQTYYTSNTAPPELVNIVPVFSDGDLAAFLGFGEFTGFLNPSITSILVSPAGTFALRVGDNQKMQAANNLLQPIGIDSNGNPIDSPDMKKYKDEFDEKVIQACGDTDNACFKTNFINFIKTFKLSNGQSLGILLFEATFDSNGNITGWTQL